MMKYSMNGLEFLISIDHSMSISMQQVIVQTVALSEAILNNEDGAVKKYLEFLSMGGSAYPLDELKHAGVDFSTPEPVSRALTKFSQILDDVEETLKKL